MSPKYQRFWPGPHGTEAEIVVPMTDFSIIDTDPDKLPKKSRDSLKSNTGALREQLQQRGFAHGNKISSELNILLEESTSEITRLMLHGGPSLLQHFRAILDIPKTPATRREDPQTPTDLFEIICTQHMGGNSSNILRSEIHMARAGVGAELHKVFSPPDRYLDPWMQQNLGEISDRFEFHKLKEIESRYGAAFPYDDKKKGKEQRFSTNTPQAPTVDVMEPFVDELRNCDFVVVSEGLGSILQTGKVKISQLFNPTSALHLESALEVFRRCKNGISDDRVFVNDTEIELWIKVIENRTDGTPMKDLPDAKFSSPFKTQQNGNATIDKNAVSIVSSSHRRWLRLVRPPETSHMTCHTGVGCGPQGGQYQFQCNGKYYIGCADTPTRDGAKKLIQSFGGGKGQTSIKTKDVVGAGDAAYVASILSMLHTPLEDIFRTRDSSLTDDQMKVAVAAFHSILGRVFGELAYRSHNRDLTGIPHESFPRILDAVVDKSIAAADKITVAEKTPQRIYTDKDWGLNFTMWELEL
jgi:hypothetical protein